MKILTLVLILAWLPETQTAVAGDKHSSAQSNDQGGDISATEDPSQVEYITEQFECTVMEVSTQYESAPHKSSFHCIEDTRDSVNTDGKVFQLVDLPPEFEQTYHSKFSSGRAKLKLRNFYRGQFDLIFTANTVWSIAGIEELH